MTRVNKNKFIAIIICIVIFAVGAGLIFGVLRPQDKYIKIYGKVGESHPLKRYTVVYNIDGKDYEIIVTDMDGRMRGGYAVIWYKEDNPQKIRPQGYAYIFSIIILLEYINLIVLINTIRYQKANNRNDNYTEKNAIKTKRRIIFYGVTLAIFVIFIIFSKTIFDALGTAVGG